MENKIKPIQIEGDVAYVTLTKGYKAVIDVEDVPSVEAYNWRVQTKGNNAYAVRSEPIGGGKQTTVRMHRQITDASPETQVDHIDHNGLNNKRQNLRLCEGIHNTWNARRRCNNTSGYKGVSWSGAMSKWRARINVKGEEHRLGYFDTPQEAHQAYCEASKKYHKEFGCPG